MQLTTKEEFIRQLEAILELDGGALSPETVLIELNEWDSMAFLSVIAFFDSKLSRKITASELRKATKLSDLMKLAGL